MVAGCEQATDAQECVTTCTTPVTTYKAVQETRAVTKMVARTVYEPVTTCETVTTMVPETTYVTTAVSARTKRAVNVPCVITGLRAYANCAYQKRAARRAARAARRTVAVVMPPTGC